MNAMLPRMGKILLNILINRLGSREKHADYLSRWGNIEEIVNSLDSIMIPCFLEIRVLFSSIKWDLSKGKKKLWKKCPANL